MPFSSKPLTRASDPTGTSVSSHGRDFRLVSNDGSVDLYEIISDEAHLRVSAVSEKVARMMIDEIASGRSAKRFEDFQASLDMRVEAVSSVVSDALADAGYVPSHTGGGCMAWRRDGAADTHVLISYDLDLDGDPNASEWTVGLYEDEKGSSVVDRVTLADAIRLAGELPASDVDLYFGSEADLLRHLDAVAISPN